MTPARPAHLQPRLLLLVALGGTLGTAAREAIVLAAPAASGELPLAVLAVNLAGAFALGALVAALARAPIADAARRDARVALGTGLLGGFTTYGAVAMDTVGLAAAAPALAIAYAGGSVVAGVAAAFAGGAAVAALARRGDA